MSEIYWMLELNINGGQQDNFKTLMNEMVKATGENESGALIYEWSTNADETQCHILERYENSKAIMEHMKGFAPFAERFMEVFTPVKFTVYGNPDEEAREALAALKPVYMDIAAGFKR